MNKAQKDRKKILDILEYGFAVEKSIHKGWIDFNNLSKKNVRQMFGKYQYTLTSTKGCISCVEFVNYFEEGDNFFEIFCVKGNLFENVERFKTLDQAFIQAKEYLC